MSELDYTLRCRNDAHKVGLKGYLGITYGSKLLFPMGESRSHSQSSWCVLQFSEENASPLIDQFPLGVTVEADDQGEVSKKPSLPSMKRMWLAFLPGLCPQ